MVALDLGFPEELLKECKSWTVYFPSTTFPNTVCLPSSQGQGTKVMKNCDPLVFGPALAIDRRKGTSCL